MHLHFVPRHLHAPTNVNLLPTIDSVHAVQMEPLHSTTCAQFNGPHDGTTGAAQASFESTGFTQTNLQYHPTVVQNNFQAGPNVQAFYDETNGVQYGTIQLENTFQAGPTAQPSHDTIYDIPYGTTLVENNFQTGTGVQASYDATYDLQYGTTLVENAFQAGQSAQALHAGTNDHQYDTTLSQDSDQVTPEVLATYDGTIDLPADTNVPQNNGQVGPNAQVTYNAANGLQYATTLPNGSALFGQNVQLLAAASAGDEYHELLLNNSGQYLHVVVTGFQNITTPQNSGHVSTSNTYQPDAMAGLLNGAAVAPPHHPAIPDLPSTNNLPNGFGVGALSNGQLSMQSVTYAQATSIAPLSVVAPHIVSLIMGLP